MKKIIIVLMLLILVLFVSNINVEEKEDKEETRAVFISYIELQKYIKGNDINTIKNNIDNMIINIKGLNLNTIILQVRVSQDAMYNSKIFPYSNYVSNKDQFDILSYFIEKSHNNNIKLIAWINPYRVSTNEDINSIKELSPAYKYINTDYLYIGNGIYFNPAKQEVEELIIKGVEEVLEYKVDGILFDDYFYQSNDCDKSDYEEYLKDNPNISIEDYHLNIVNKMVERVHEKCKSKNVLFGISPDGNIDNNYNKNYADVKTWMNSDKYIDFIMPQIYYGFYNSTRAYANVIKEWSSLLKNKDINLYIALAFYKVGIEDKYALAGRDEWINNDNIIMREVILSRNLKNYKGFALFRYDNLFDKDIYTLTSEKELNNLKKIVK